MNPKPYPGTQAVLRAVSLLKAFDDERAERSLSELAQHVGLNKTTVFRLLSALESEGLVARSSDGYTLGPEIVVLGGRALRGNDLRALTRPALEMLAAHSGETASLETLVQGEILIIDEVLGEHFVGGTRSLGMRMPIHVTSTGLAILAHLPERELAPYLQRPLEAITPHTITDPVALRAELARVRDRGCAITDETLEIGLLAIGAPLRNHDGRVQAAISVFGPKTRLFGQRVVEIEHLLQETAATISAQLGYKP